MDSSSLTSSSLLRNFSCFYVESSSRPDYYVHPQSPARTVQWLTVQSVVPSSPFHPEPLHHQDLIISRIWYRISYYKEPTVSLNYYPLLTMCPSSSPTQTARSITTLLPPSTQSQILNRLSTIRSTSTTIRTRPGTRFLKADVLHHCSHDSCKGTVTLADHARGLEVAPSIHKPWRLCLGFVAAPVIFFLHIDAYNAQRLAPSTIGRYWTVLAGNWGWI